MMLKAIIFDFDYTLGDSTNGIALSINYALEKLGYEAEDLTTIKKTIGLSLKDTYTVLTKMENIKEAEQFSQLFKEKADQVMVENTQLYKGVKEVLQNLKMNGYKIAIVTTKFHYRIEQILDKFRVTDLIDLIVGLEDVKEAKPNPEGLNYAISKLGVKKDEILYVGDSVVDAKTAQNAEVHFAAVLTGTTTREEFDGYSKVYVAESVEEIYRNLKQNDDGDKIV